jgi:hypothetical protein
MTVHISDCVDGEKKFALFCTPGSHGQEVQMSCTGAECSVPFDFFLLF